MPFHPAWCTNRRRPGERTMTGRPVRPDAITHAAVYRASDEAAFVQGTVSMWMVDAFHSGFRPEK
jgi:hypothetical protein